MQKTIAYSSTEAEYMVLSDCTHQVTWIWSLLGELSYKLNAILICDDNQGSIFMASNPVIEPCSKHINIHYHGIRESVAKGKVKLFFIDGAENPADLLTKNLPHQQFHKNLPEHHRFCNIPTIVHSFSQHPRSLQKIPVLQGSSPEHHRSPRMLQFHRNN